MKVGLQVKRNRLFELGRCLYLPSYNEGLPIAILEAMAYSHPIISTPVGGIPEIIKVVKWHLVQPGDTKGIADAIKFYVENRDAIRKQGNNAFNIVQDFSQRKYLEI